MYRRWIAAGSVTSVLIAGLALVPLAPAVAAKPRHVADVTSRPDSVSAQLAARTTGHRVMDLSQSTVYGDVYANPNGTWTAETASGPVQVQDSRGVWHPINSTLVVGKDGRLRAMWALDDATFSAGGDSTVATMTNAGVPSTWSWPSKLPKPTITGNVATYKISDVENLVVTASGTGFAEDIVLTKRPNSAQSLVLPMQAKGGSIKRTANGGLQVTNARGKTAMFIPKPFAYDSSVNAGGDPQVGALQTSVAADGSLTLTPDAGFLSNPKTVYPVTIDPSFTIYTSGDTWIENPDYPSSQYTSAELRVGTWDSGANVARSYLGFSQTNFNGRHILSANLILRNYYSGSCTGAAIYAQRVTASWSPSSVSWSAQPAATTSGEVSYSGAWGYSSSCAANNATWDITGIAQAWSNGTARDGIRLVAGDEGSNYTWRRYRSLEYTVTPSYEPKITATYNSYPNTPTSPTFSPVSSYTPPGGSASNYTSSSTPTVSSTVSDPDGGTVRATFSFYTSETGSVVASCTSSYVASGTTASCHPSAALSNTTYYVKSQAYDSTDYSKSYSSWSTIVVANGTPAAPVITCPGYTNDSWATTRPSSNVSCAISATGSGTPAPGKIQYTIDGVTTTATIPQSTDPSVAKVNVSVSKSSGLHMVSATAISPSGTASSGTSLQFGYGSVSIDSPRPLFPIHATDDVSIQASGPPPGSGENPTPTAQLLWRQAGSSTWTPATTTATLTVTNSNGEVSIAGTWDSTTDLTAANLDTGVPQLLDLQVCVTYSSTRTLCSSDSENTQILHVAHAFGGNFPTTNVPDGQVALSNGEFSNNATDASLSAGTATLSVGRTHYSFQSTSKSAIDNVFGPGWIGDLNGDNAGHADARVTDNTLSQGAFTVLESDGTSLVYGPPLDSQGHRLPVRDSNGNVTTGTWTPLDPTTVASNTSLYVDSTNLGDPSLVVLKDSDGTTTTFTPTAPPTSTTAGAYAQAGAVKEAPSSSATTYTYDTSGHITQMLAPVPANVDCSTKMNAGCRALDITYWTQDDVNHQVPGAYANQVASIATVVGDTSGGATTQVAKYAYDPANGHLLTVTDPRTSPNLATTYTYVPGTDLIASIQDPGLTPTDFTYNASDELTQVTRLRPSDSAGAGTNADLATIVYGIPVTGSQATSLGLPDMGGAAVSAWGQTVAPTVGVAVFGPDRSFGTVPTANTLTSADMPFAEAYYTDAQGNTFNTGVYGEGRWLLTDTEYDALGNTIRQLSTSDIAAVQAGTLAPSDAGTLTVYNAQHVDSVSGAVTLNADSEVTDTFKTARWVTLASGAVVWARPHEATTYDESAPNNKINPATGQEYALPTTVTTGVATPSTIVTAAGSSEPADLQVTSVVHSGYSNAVPGGATNAGWDQGLTSTTSTVMDATISGGTQGATPIVKTTAYNTLGQTTSSSQPLSNGTDAGTRLTTYYQAGTGSGVGVCDNHPELQGVVCQTTFAGNPASGPAMITTTYTYNAQQEPLTTTEVSGATTRTTTKTYDAPGRLITKSVTVAGSSGSTAVAATTIGYDQATGLENSTTPAGGANGGAITIGHDAWGRVNTYTNSNGMTTTTYDAAGHQATVTAADGTVTSYVYDGSDANGAIERRGLLTSETATAHGVTTTISLAYDASQNAVVVNYGGGVSLTNSYNTGGDLTGRVYSGDITDPSTNNVTPNSQWIGWTRTVDAAGRIATEWTPDGGATTATTTGAAATGFADSYTYDPANRLTQVVDQTVPAGVGGVSSDGIVSGGTCTIRTYSFDRNGNRSSKTVIPPNADGSCQSTSSPAGAVTTTWSHDAADRITNSGYAYDDLGRVTSIPQADTPLAQAGGTPGPLALAYFDTDQIRSQTQNGTTIMNTLDAAGRPLTQAAGPTGGSVTSTTTIGYTDTTDAPAFATTTSNGSTTSQSFVTTSDGTLSAILTGDGVAHIVVADPQGTAVSEITLPSGADASGLDSWSTSDEYGNPTSVAAGATPTNLAGGLGYGWTGAYQRSTMSTGLIQMGSRLYDPMTGTFTSVDPIFGGNETSYSYPDDPVNEMDLTGQQHGYIYGPVWGDDHNEKTSSWQTAFSIKLFKFKFRWVIKYEYKWRNFYDYYTLVRLGYEYTVIETWYQQYQQCMLWWCQTLPGMDWIGEETTKHLVYYRDGD